MAQLINLRCCFKILAAFYLLSLLGCKAEITGREMPNQPQPKFESIDQQSLANIDVSIAGQFHGALVLNGSDDISYGISVPQIAMGQKVPLVLALHYASGNGRDYLSYSIAPALAGLNGIIISPSAIKGEGWVSNNNINMLKELLDYAISHWPIDPDKIVVTGYSMGGSGAWALASRYPQLLSAALPMAASPNQWINTLSKEVPIYVIHPEFDTTTSLQDMQSNVSLLQSKGLDIQLHIVPAANHSDWDLSASYLNDAIDWLEYTVWAED